MFNIVSLYKIAGFHSSSMLLWILFQDSGATWMHVVLPVFQGSLLSLSSGLSDDPFSPTTTYSTDPHVSENCSVLFPSAISNGK